MTDMKLMESKEPTYEVVSAVGRDIGAKLLVETDIGNYGLFIRITDESNHISVCLSGPEAIALSEFIAAHVRKRW